MACVSRRGAEGARVGGGDVRERAGVSVTLLAVPYDAYAAKLEAAIPRDNGPDLFVSPHERLGSYLSNHLVAPAGDAFPESDVARYDAKAVDAITYQGTRYAVPLASKCVALYINTKLLPQAPSTLDQLERLKGKLGPGVSPLVYEAQSVYFHIPLLHAYGGKIFDGQTYAMVGPEAERAADKAHDLIASGVVPPEASGALVKQLFASGKAAAVISGPWLAGDLGAGVTYRVVPLPSIEGAGKMQPFLTVDGAFLTPQGAKRKEARELARFFADDASASVRRIVGKQDVVDEERVGARRRSTALGGGRGARRVPPGRARRRAHAVVARDALDLGARRRGAQAR